MIRGTLTCGGLGLSGKTITLTSSKLSYVGALGTVVSREDGSFFKSYKPASTAKPLTTVSAWFLGGPDEGGIASKVVTPQGGPQSSNTASTPQESSNNGNTAQEKGASNNGNAAQVGNTGNIQQGASNNEQGAPSSKAGQCKSAITQLSAVYYPPYRNWKISGELTCGGTGLSGKTIILTNSKLSYVGKLGTVLTGATGLGGEGFFVTSSIKPTATTAKPGSTLSAWYLGGPDEGGIASKTITLPQLTAEQNFAKPTPQTGEEKGASSNG